MSRRHVLPTSTGRDFSHVLWAVMNGRGDEVLDLAKANLLAR
jgi:hypothetical protein